MAQPSDDRPDRGGGSRGGKGRGGKGGPKGGKEGGQKGGQKGGRGRDDQRGQPKRDGGGQRRRSAHQQDDRVQELSGPLTRVLRRLPDIEREVLEWRMGLKDGHPTDLSTTARHLNLTMHEAKQIEQRAFERIREVVPLKQLQRLLQG